MTAYAWFLIVVASGFLIAWLVLDYVLPLIPRWSRALVCIYLLGVMFTLVAWSGFGGNGLRWTGPPSEFWSCGARYAVSWPVTVPLRIRLSCLPEPI